MTNGDKFMYGFYAYLFIASTAIVIYAKYFDPPIRVQKRARARR